MKTFVVTWWTNYGEFVEIIVANSEKHAEQFFFKEHKFKWDIIKEVDASTFGIKFSGGDVR